MSVALLGGQKGGVGQKGEMEESFCYCMVKSACAHIHPKVQRASCVLCFSRVRKENKFPPSCLHRRQSTGKVGTEDEGSFSGWCLPIPTSSSEGAEEIELFLAASVEPYKNTPKHQILIVLELISQKLKVKKFLFLATFFFPTLKFLNLNIFLFYLIL